MIFFKSTLMTPILKLLALTFTSPLNLSLLETPLETNSGYATVLGDATRFLAYYYQLLKEERPMCRACAITCIWILVYYYYGK